MPLVLLPLLDSQICAVQICPGREPLNRLVNQVSIRHGMPHNRSPEACSVDDIGNVSHNLALARPRSHCANGYHLLPRLQHGMPAAQKAEVSAYGKHPFRQIHYILVVQVAVGENASVYPAIHNYILKVILRPDGKASRVKVAA